MHIFALFLGAGASIGVWEVARTANPHYTAKYVNASLLTLLAAGVGSRLVFVFLHWAYYRERVSEVFQFWQGGLSAPGALFGAFLAVALLSIYQDIPLPRLADSLAPFLTPMGISVWLGCWAAGSAYGFEASPDAWWVFLASRVGEITTPRFPLQFTAALILLILFALIEFKTEIKKIPGQKACLMSLGITCVYLGATFLMGDPAPRWLFWRPETWMAGSLALTLLVVYASTLYLYRKKSGSIKIIDPNP